MKIQDMTPEQVRAMQADELIEAIAQMLYDLAGYASDSEDAAVTEAVQNQYRTESLTYCGAAEHVRNLVRGF